MSQAMTAPVVESSARRLQVAAANVIQGRSARRKAIGHHGLGPAVPYPGLLDELQRRGLTPRLAGVGFQDLALMIQRPPEVVDLAADLHVDLVEMPRQWMWARMRLTRFRPLSAANIVPKRFHQT